jgi:hypothetical protein
MEAMRESWTDRRLDEFRESTERRFDRVDGRLDEMDRLLQRIDTDLRELRTQIGSFQRVLFQFCGGMIVTVALGFAGLMVTHL